MKKNKFKCLLVMLALCIANNPLKVIADTGNTIFDGGIGEWDYNIDKLPENGMEIEGTIPKNNMISVTVPISMEFMVLPNSSSAFGSFYSPKYTMKNNGMKPIVAKVKSFSEDGTVTPGSDETPLKIKKVVPGDGETQMELNLCTLDDTIFNNIDKKIDLTDVGSLTEDDRTLFEITSKGEKKVKFFSDKWELPQYESRKDKAVGSYTAEFEFSIK